MECDTSCTSAGEGSLAPGMGPAVWQGLPKAPFPRSLFLLLLSFFSFFFLVNKFEKTLVCVCPWAFCVLAGGVYRRDNALLPPPLWLGLILQVVEEVRIKKMVGADKHHVEKACTSISKLPYVKRRVE